jgi:transcriptional regulator with XRE-family HTH domain
MLPERLKELRNQKGITQEDVANYLGITRPAYTAYESGRRQPDDTIKGKLADYYNVSLDYLLGRTDKRNESSNGGPTDLDDPSTILRFEGRQIPQKDIELMKQIFRRMREEH